MDCGVLLALIIQMKNAIRRQLQSGTSGIASASLNIQDLRSDRSSRTALSSSTGISSILLVMYLIRQCTNSSIFQRASLVTILADLFDNRRCDNVMEFGCQLCRDTVTTTFIEVGCLRTSCDVCRKTTTVMAAKTFTTSRGLLSARTSRFAA